MLISGKEGKSELKVVLLGKLEDPVVITLSFDAGVCDVLVVVYDDITYMKLMKVTAHSPYSLLICYYVLFMNV